MPATTECTSCCATAITTNIPGTAGQSAFTTTGANLTLVASPATTALLVGNSDWIAVGEVVFISDGVDWGHFEVVGIPDSTHITVEWLDYTNDAAVASVIGSGAKVVASGTQENIADPLAIANGGTGAANAATALDNLLSSAPLPIANGGTAGATKAAAIAALGVGQNATVDTNAAIGYAITNTASDSAALIATVSVPVTGLYLVLAQVTVNYNGVTFTDEVLTVAVRNATAGNYVTTCAKDTNSVTTTDFPSFDYVTPFVTASLTAGDALQIWVDLSTVESAGSSTVTAASLAIIPLAI